MWSSIVYQPRRLVQAMLVTNILKRPKPPGLNEKVNVALEGPTLEARSPHENLAKVQ
jgi:hypothetical protein